ncbi:hypothetical protein HMPREF9141_0896 [Prevotella multiformis DSM 16608]|uniref:Uncharacterized protein n=1 Tax=Prevotella multiformis DSM 16608 TaxID=888743 RepID=F0F5N0_9BACT|nr:hypothetical protein HMPREF9141_0896 [Prevotella multiformis DSM 16608]
MGDLRLIGGHEYRYWERGCLDPAIQHHFMPKLYGNLCKTR